MVCVCIADGHKRMLRVILILIFSKCFIYDYKQSNVFIIFIVAAIVVVGIVAVAMYVCYTCIYFLDYVIYNNNSSVYFFHCHRLHRIATLRL